MDMLKNKEKKKKKLEEETKKETKRKMEKEKGGSSAYMLKGVILGAHSLIISLNIFYSI